MKKPAQKMILCFLCLLGIAISAGSAWADENSNTHTIMRPDRETLLRWIQDYKEAPRVYIDEAIRLLIPLRGSVSLLSRLDYIPSERDQGICGNCWAWSGTAVMAIALHVQCDVPDRLSVQYLNSCDSDSGYACCGGWLSDLADYYTDVGQAVPWSNTNASWKDGTQECSYGLSDVSCDSISTSKRYPIASMEAQTIETQGQDISKEDAIANIKAVLNHNKAVWFGFFMGTEADWNDFRDFWNNQSEDVLWNFNSSCDKEWVDGEGGGHAVLCVGYNDFDPDNSYWIMLNSWGETDGRPNGLFRVAMDMDYDCKDTNEDYNLYWQTLDIDFGTAPSATTDAATSLTSGSATLNGTVNPNLENTTYYFEYGKTTDYGSTTTSAGVGSGVDNIPISCEINGLTANTTYHFRLMSANSAGTTNGDDNTFTTSSAAGGGGGGGCFIATAVYGSPMHPHVEALREFRDRYLLATTQGKGFVDFCYNCSPPICDLIAKYNFLKVMVRCSLLPVVGLCYASLHFGMTNTVIILFLVSVLSVIFSRAFMKTLYSRN